MVTRREVAERAGVSVATVSNVLNKKGIVQPETEKSREIAELMGKPVIFLEVKTELVEK